MPREPRIALDVGSVRAEMTGVGAYIHKLAGGLSERAPERIAWIGVRSGGPFDGAAGAVDSTSIDGHSRYLPWLLRHADRDAQRVGADLAHYPVAVAPLRARVPYVLTIHDLSTLRDPLHHPPLRVARVGLIAIAAHRARAVVVPSRTSMRDVVRGLQVPGRRVILVPHAAVRQLEPGERPGDATILARHGVTVGRYVLATGGIDPRKNPVRLAEALGRMGTGHADLQLIICGPPGWRHEAIRAAIEAVPAAARIRIVGYVPDDELEALLRNAALFAFVSLHEGFGLPILEAMSGGVPVVTSRVSSMPEVAAGAAILVDPRDVDDIARGLRQALAQRDRLIRAGQARVGSRTWPIVADEMLEIYRWAARLG